MMVNFVCLPCMMNQATLGLGDSKGRSIVQCSVGDKSPIFLCSLLPKKNESCPLNLEFEEDEEAVTFSVIGKQSVHLSGYFETYDEVEGEPVGEGFESYVQSHIFTIVDSFPSYILCLCFFYGYSLFHL